MGEAEFRELLAVVSGEHAYEMRARDRGHDFLVEYLDSDGHTLVYAEVDIAQFN